MNRRLLTPVAAFTLIELLVVVGIIALLISILLPSLGRAREQAKAVHCLARLHDFGSGLVTYCTDHTDSFPPALWNFVLPDDPRSNFHYGWSELLWSYVYREDVLSPHNFPVQRNVDGRMWAKYMLCRTSRLQGESSGHYRVYLPSWSNGSFVVLPRQRWQLTGANGKPNYPDPRTTARYSELRPRLVLIGDSNETSYRGNDDPAEDNDGDGFDDNDGSWIDAAEANESGPDGNRFSDRHYGYTDYLFADMHAAKDAELREILARDWDQNGVVDVEDEGQDVGEAHP